jgi:hypothetical protein
MGKSTFNITTEIKFWIISILILVVKIIAASSTNLGNDEVYYVLYARYPALSHFDHPLMVGLMIQLSTLNLLLDHEIFIRLGPVILSFLTGWVLFKSVSRIAGENAGLFAVVLFHTSIYFTLMAGLFVMPDAPQIFFLALALNQAFYIMELNREPRTLNWLLFGLFVGLATLSKYTSLFYWPVMLVLLVLFKPRQFLKPWVYVAGLITLICLTPVLWWNFQNNFYSFTFHGNRILTENTIRWDYFFRELFGQIVYQSPFVFLLIIAGMVRFRSVMVQIGRNHVMLLYFLFFPLIITFLYVSLTRPTLPHWSGPAFLAAIAIGAVWVSQAKKIFRKVAYTGLVITTAFLLISPVVINKGLFLGNVEKKHNVTLDMFGWDQAPDSFRNRLPGISAENTVFACSNWFPAAHYYHYLANPNGMKLYVNGTIDKTHKFYEINQRNSFVPAGFDLVFLSHSRYSKMNFENLVPLFEMVHEVDSIPIRQNERVAGYFYFSVFENAIRKINPNEFNL